LSNAIKFTFAGKICVHVRLIGESQGMAAFFFEVSDTGIGISSEEQSGLFQPFSQADVSTTRRFGGTGLGLVICKRLTELMGGSISVESELGSGSTFRFTIRGQLADMTDSSRPHAASLPEVESSFGGSARVLVVEDNLTNQKLAHLMLRNIGVASDIVSNGAEAVTAAQKTKYDLVLMDCVMPEMDGFEATRRLRQVPGFEEIPILAMTANAYPEDREACLAAGMDDYLTKPVRQPVLYQKLSHWLPTRPESD
jgi:two-component system sensor histidine kinase/response regulator